MAKTSKIAKNKKRAVLVARYADRRAELLKIIKDPEVSYEDKREAYVKIAKMPRDASATRYRNRCNVTGRLDTSASSGCRVLRFVRWRTGANCLASRRPRGNDVHRSNI